MKKYIFVSSILIFFFLGLIPDTSQGQELNCQVSVSANQVQSSKRDRFNELQKSINDFLNNREWTNINFKVEERIECSMLIIIKKEVATDKFQASIQVQSRRPVYNTSYNSPIFNFKDEDFTFEYKKHQNLKFDLNSFKSNLTSVLAYYAYLIIGLDFDTFSSEGGTQFYKNAQSIVSSAQNSEFKGWKSFESKQNRYWLVKDLLRGSLSALREGYYIYHRHGLDIMAEEQKKAQQKVLAALKKIKKAKEKKPQIYIIEVLMNTKKDEIVNIFDKASPKVQKKAINRLKELDPAHAKSYDKIQQD